MIRCGQWTSTYGAESGRLDCGGVPGFCWHRLAFVLCLVLAWRPQGHTCSARLFEQRHFVGMICEPQRIARVALRCLGHRM